MHRSRRLIISLLIIVGLVSVVGVGASSAFLNDSEFSLANIFGAGDESPDFDLLVNEQNNPTGIVVLDDLKPGDDREQDKTVRVNSSAEDEARLYLHLKDLVATQGAQTEPEEKEEGNNPKSDIQNYLTYDLTIDGDTLIDYADNILLPDAVSCWIPLGIFATNTTFDMTQSFHFDPAVTNWAQGDILNFVEEFLALSPDAPEPGFPDGSNRVWNENTRSCEDSSILWIIGDEEAAQTDNPVDELNFVDIGSLPTPPASGDPYNRTIVSPQDDVADKEFPWNSNYNKNYARQINIDFDYAGPTVNVRLSLGWSPGRSASEQKQVLFDAGILGVTPVRIGISTPGWWENMPRFVDTFDFSLDPGNHTITLNQLYGDGTLWDFIKLEKI